MYVNVLSIRSVTEVSLRSRAWSGVFLSCRSCFGCLVHLAVYGSVLLLTLASGVWSACHVCVYAYVRWGWQSRGGRESGCETRAGVVV